MGPLHVPIRMFDFEIEPPLYTRSGDAALDLRSTIDTVINPGMRTLIPCGFAMALPAGYCGLVVPRSGLALHHGIGIVNGPGLIDADYRGEVAVILINHDPENPFTVRRGDRIAQLLILAVPTVNFVETESLPSTERGEAGFGSSGQS